MRHGCCAGGGSSEWVAVDLHRRHECDLGHIRGGIPPGCIRTQCLRICIHGKGTASSRGRHVVLPRVANVGKDTVTVERNPWSALGALIVGFALIVLDMSVVAVANPAIMEALKTSV